MRTYICGLGALSLILGASIWHNQELSKNLERMGKTVAQLEQAGQTTKRDVQSLANEGAATRLLLSNQVHVPIHDGLAAPSSAAVGVAAEAQTEPPVDVPLTADSVVVDPKAPDPSVQRTMANLDASFESQVVDRNWAADAAATLREKASALLSQNSEIQSLECRSTMCKMESIQADVKQYQDFTLEFAKSRAFPQLYLTRTGETSDGRLVMTMYVAKEGTQLPYSAD
jgi:cell division protein FtsB